MENAPFGLELTLSAHLTLIKSKLDALATLIHYVLLSSGNLRCVGMGEAFTLEGEFTSSECMPCEFFQNSIMEDGSKALRYRGNGIKKTEKYIFKVLPLQSNGVSIFNLYRVSDEKCSSITLDTEKLLSKNPPYGNLSEILVELSLVLSDIQRNLMDPLFPPSKEETPKEVILDNSQRIFTREPNFYLPPTMPSNPFDIGSSDLHPFGRVGGGMLMDPTRSRFPIRYDSPGFHLRPDGRRFGDEMPPPDFEDSFM